jgi:hypothetical protein
MYAAVPQNKAQLPPCLILDNTLFFMGIRFLIIIASTVIICYSITLKTVSGASKQTGTEHTVRTTLQKIL